MTQEEWEAAALPPHAERRLIRRAAGLSLTEVAERVGTTHTSVSLWERGMEPGLRFRAKYTAVLDELRATMEQPRSSSAKETITQ